ncbi:Bbp16 family capsid cement protein [Hwanghaeella sp.]|uniref:Bbp16 family capsid cement protein n=1 Tax=Hwanghaeella sp. TaxID=2605943 RepID=UPI003CCB83D0
MILDSELLLSDAQEVTATGPSDDFIDFGANRDVGPGTPVPLLIQVASDFSDMANLTVDLQTSGDPTFSSDVSVLASMTVPVADLVRGYQFPIAHLPNHCRRYFRLNYTVGTPGASPGGAITAGIVWGVQTNR